MAQPINHLFETAKPDGVLVGTGKSLDSFDEGEYVDTHTIMAVNCAAPAVECHYFIALHMSHGLEIAKRSNATPILHKSIAHVVDGSYYFRWPRAGIAQKEGTVPKIYRSSTASLAIWIMKRMGIDNILMVGFDAVIDPGRVEIADKVRRHRDVVRPIGYYQEISQRIIKAVSINNINAIWRKP